MVIRFLTLGQVTPALLTKTGIWL